MGRQLLILAGGKGTRLRDRLGDLPKPMIPIGGRPLLEHQIALARHYGFDRILLFVCHGAESIRHHFGDGASFGVTIEYILEREPLGTAGAVLAGYERLDDRFLVMYGDTMVHVDLAKFWRAHTEASPAWEATLLVHPNDHPRDSDLVEADEGHRIVAFHHRPHPPGVWRRNLVNAALYVLEKRALTGWANRRGSAPWDFGRDLFPALLAEGSRLQAYNSPEYIKDIGTPSRYDRVCAQFASGLLPRSSLAEPQRAVFLDRDGTIVVDKDCLRRAEDLELLPGAGEAIRMFNHHGWRTVVVTNQPVVAKGWADESEVQRMHNKMEMLLGDEHAYVDRIYFCPHHPDQGFAGERPELKGPCACRKPATGMIERGVDELHIDLAQSWMIGDTTTDLQTASHAGLRSILVETGAGGRDGKYPAAAQHTFPNLLEAARFLVKETSL